jgi:hypothetical protein
LCAGAFGNEIIVWYSQPPGGYTVIPVTQSVLIWRAGTYKVKAVNASGQPGIIRSVTSTALVGTVTLHVVDEVGGAGAQDMG